MFGGELTREHRAGGHLEIAEGTFNYDSISFELGRTPFTHEELHVRPCCRKAPAEIAARRTCTKNKNFHAFLALHNSEPV